MGMERPPLLLPVFATALFLAFPAIGDSAHSARIRREAVAAITDYETIQILLTVHSPQQELLERLVATSENIDYNVKKIGQTMNNLPQQLTQQLSAAKIIETEDELRNELDEYHVILQAIRNLHANGSGSDNATFLATAANIEKDLANLRNRVKDTFPNLLRSLDRNLRGATVAGQGSTEGLLCDASVNALKALETSHNLTASVRASVLAMQDGFDLLQEVATDLFRITCERNDPVCVAKVEEFRQNPDQQHERLEECIPAWLISLARDGAVSGRLQVKPENRAVTQVGVKYEETDETKYFPELHAPQDGSQENVALVKFDTHYRLVVGETCFVTLHNNNFLRCSFPHTTQDALFAVETSRDGSTWLWNVQTKRYLVAGVTQERCREGVLDLSEHRGAPWTFDRNFRPNNETQPFLRACLTTPAPTTTATTTQLAVHSDTGHFCPGLTSLALPLMTLTFLISRAIF